MVDQSTIGNHTAAGGVRAAQLTAMISSTALDLPEHRAAVMQACLAANVRPIAMEHLPARDASGLKVSLEMVDEADIYIGIYAWRYGWVPKGETKSITELEFDRAVESKAEGKMRELFIFTAHDDHPIKAKDKEASSAAQVKLKRFKKRAAEGRVRKEFSSPAELRTLVTEALYQFMRRSEPSEPVEEPKGGILARIAVRESTSVSRYLSALHRRFAHHNSLGLPAVEDPKHKRGPDKIADLFVPPTCMDGHVSPEAFERSLREGKNEAACLLERLKRERRVVLLADPGMGKSMLIQWLVVALSAPDHRVPEAAHEFGKMIPLPFILRDLVRLLPEDPKRWKWQALVDAFLKHRPTDTLEPGMAEELTRDDAVLRDVLRSANTWFLLDGLDEIGDPERRRALRAAIWEGFQRHPQARFLITSRVVGYEEVEVDRTEHHDGAEKARETVLKGPAEVSLNDPRTRPDCTDRGRPALLPDSGRDAVAVPETVKRQRLATRLYLAPWDDAQQEAFSQHWFLQRFGEGEGPGWGVKFIRAVRSHPSTATIGRVPNLLLLMALLYRYRADLPSGRAKVYASISEAYLGGIDIHRELHDGLTALTVPYKLTEKEFFLAIVAVQMQFRRAAAAGECVRGELGQEQEPEKEVGAILITQVELEESLMPVFGGARDARACDQLRKFLRYVADRSGLLLPRGQGVYGFAHLSFQEFYAACYLEQEFRRLLNAQAAGEGTASGGLFRKAVVEARPGGPLLKKQDFADWASETIWCEPLLFLVERLAASAHDTATVMDWMFPWQEADHKTQPPKPVLPLQSAILLATLSVDPQVNLDAAQRRVVWAQLWKSWLEWPFGSYRKLRWHIPPALLQATDFQEQVIEELVARASGVKKLDLSRCTGLNNVDLVEKFVSLETLVLEGCTGLDSLDAIAGLQSLQTLYLVGCTGLCSVEPLGGLCSLQVLYLDGCTGISDVGPLAGISELHTLSLTGCINLPEENVEALRQKRPDCRIFR